MVAASALADFAQIFLSPLTWSVTGRSLLVSTLATLIALDLGLIFASVLLRARGLVARVLEALFGAFVAIPAVVIGLLALMFFASTWFDGTRITLTLIPMIVAQAALLLPLATTLLLQTLRASDARLGLELENLGARRTHHFDALLHDSWPTVAATSVLVFSRGIAEVGTVLIVGGNIEGRTQVLTTLIAEQARNGVYETAVALALILIGLALVLSWGARMLSQRAES